MGEDNHSNEGRVPTIPMGVGKKPEVPESDGKPGKKNVPPVSIPRVPFAIAGTVTPEEIDNAVHKNSIESDRAYRKITEDIIQISSKQLTEHNNDKKPLRVDLLDYIKRLLTAQFVVLVFILILNDVASINISDDVIKVYIVSVFVETLAGLIIMIKYAFDSTQEVNLIAILNEIISHFKKFEEK